MKTAEIEKIFELFTYEINQESIENYKKDKLYQDEYLKYLEKEYNLINENLKNREILDLKNEPFIEDLELINYYNSIYKLCNTTFEKSGNFYWIYILKMVNILLNNGNIKKNSIYSTYSIYLASRGEYSSAYKFSLLDLNLNKEIKNDFDFSNSSIILANYNIPWNYHLKFSEDLNRVGMDFSIKNKDWVNSSYSSFHYIVNSYYLGKNLNVLKQEQSDSIEFVSSANNELALTTLFGVETLINDLLGENNREILHNEHSSNELIFKENKSYPLQNYAISIYNIMKAQVLYLYGNYEKGYKKLTETENSIAILGSINSIAEYYFIDSLLLTRLICNSDLETRAEYFDKLKENQLKMKNWTLNCPENYYHKYLLVEAEIAGIEYKHWKASSLYDLAILEAKKNNFIQNEGIAYECASNFYFQKRNHELGQKYLLEAYRCYKTWGAVSKCEQMKSRYSELLEENKYQENILHC
jgi:hypothetical protein